MQKRNVILLILLLILILSSFVTFFIINKKEKDKKDDENSNPILITMKPTTKYCTFIFQNMNMNHYLNTNWSTSGRIEVIDLITNVLNLTTKQLLELNKLNNIHILSLISLDCINFQNDPNYSIIININPTRWETSHRDYVISMIYDLSGNINILPFLMSLENTQLSLFIQ